MMISNRAINAIIQSGFTSTLEAKLVANQAELLSLAQEVSIEKITVQYLCKQVECKILEAHEISSEWTEKSGALLWKKDQHELLVEDIRMQAAYLDKLSNVEASHGEKYTFEEHLKQDNKELQRKVESLQQILDDTKASTGEEINRLKVGVDALAITNRYTSNSLNQKIDVLKA